jgi:hypothetical protein
MGSNFALHCNLSFQGPEFRQLIPQDLSATKNHAPVKNQGRTLTLSTAHDASAATVD